MTVQLNPEQERQLDPLAAQGGLSANEFAQEAVDKFSCLQARVHYHDEVMSIMDDIIEHG